MTDDEQPKGRVGQWVGRFAPGAEALSRYQLAWLPNDLAAGLSVAAVALPVGIEDRLDRLYELKARMDAIKGSTEAVVTYAVLNALGTASAAVECQAVRFFGSKATAVMTNVPGPREELYLAGKAVRSMMFWVPQAAHLGLGVSILSYAGQVRLGVVSDVGLVPDPASVITAFQNEMRTMLDSRTSG